MGNFLGNPRWQYFPRQKLSTKEKTKEWYKKCIDASEDIAIYREVTIRNSKREMRINYDLMADVLNQSDIEKLFDPLDFEREGLSSIDSVNNYPIILPKVNLLVGEEIKRKFDWAVRSKNEDAVSSIQQDLMSQLMETLQQELENENYSEAQLEKKIKEFSEYANYEYKDVYETVATRILQYLWREQDMAIKFNDGMKDALIGGEEIYRVDIVAGEPRVFRCNPINIYTVRLGQSNKIEDSDIIVQVDYLPVGQVIDEFYEHLTSQEISDIEEGYDKPREGHILQHAAYNPNIYVNDEMNEDNLINTGDGYANSADQLPYDMEGNVRVLRTRWRGLRKVGQLTYYDEDGEEQVEIVPEGFKENKDNGESIKWIWISEAYEGVRIGEHIYTKFGPREVQMRKLNNISFCHLGYIGNIYATNDTRALSMVSMMRTYQYMYNIFMRRLELITARYNGPIVELDLSKKPDTWDNKLWMYYAKSIGFLVVDSFNEGKKGAATGKLAGGVNNTSGGRVINPDIGNFIQQTILMLNYIESQVGRIVGITPQREGAISKEETVGGVERSVTQSSMITETWFYQHDDLKKRVLELTLDTAKVAWRNEEKKTQFLLDDLSRQFLKINGEDLFSSEFDIFITNSREDAEMRQTLQQLTHAAVQNGAPLSLIIDVMRSDSIAATSRKIEKKEQEMHEREQESLQMQQEAQAAQQQAQMDYESNEKEKDRDLKRDEIQNDYDLAMLKLMDGKDLPVDDTLDRIKLRMEEIDRKQKIKLEEDKLKETQRSNKAKEDIERNKVRNQLTIAKAAKTKTSSNK